MKKLSLLLPLLALTFHALSFAHHPSFPPKFAVAFNCSEAPFLTVLNPTCESPLTGTITVTEPLQPEFEYSIDGVNYQPNPFFDQIDPGAYQVTYRNTITGCVSEPNEAIVTSTLLFATLVWHPDSGTTFQNVCINTTMQPILYDIGGTATDAVVTGLPAGTSFSTNNGLLMISGTPTMSGVYNYTVTSNGSCPALKTGTIVVKANVALVWLSSSGNRNQSMCGFQPIVPIRFMLANGATSGTATGLPVGVNAVFDSGILTLSGMPTQVGNYNYTVSTVGGCSQSVSSGTIAVSQVVNLGLSCAGSAEQGSLSFAWNAVPGALAYNYSYTVNNGNSITGSVSDVQEATITGLSAGATVVFSVTGVEGINCFNTQTVNCMVQSLSSETFKSKSFTYFPNPVNDMLYIKAAVSVAKLQIFSMTGQQIYSSSPQSAEAEIDLSALKSGFYLMQISDDATTQTFPLVKK